MLYQLPNGKTIYLTVEEFLDLTDQDIQALMGMNAGEAVSSPFYGSAIKKGRSRQKTDEDEEEEVEEDRSIDFQQEYDEPQHIGGSEEGSTQDLLEFPDEMSLDSE